jgi:tetratricopeptide (TPR) repeat protein
MGLLDRLKGLLGVSSPEADLPVVPPTATKTGGAQIAGWSGPETDDPELDAVVRSMMAAATASDFDAGTFHSDEFQRGLSSLLEANELGDLVAVLRRASLRLRHYAPLSHALARVYMARFDNDSARELWLKLVDEGPYTAEANFALGELAGRSGALAEAATYYQRALAFDVSYPNAWEKAVATAVHLPMPSGRRAAATAGGVGAGIAGGADAAGLGIRPPDGFELVHPLGRGGYGTVYLARDLRLHRSVALKFLHPHLTRDGRRVEAFFEEARLVARLALPGVVRIYDLSPEDRLIVMEFLPRGTLRDRLASGRPLSADAALRVCGSLLKSLSRVHAAGLVHRDIKPANILFRSDGATVLGDFGVAILEDGMDGAGPAGTAAYMAPEQRAGSKGDRRMDLYAVGLILAEMLAGALPVASGSGAVDPGAVDPALVMALVPREIGAQVGPVLHRLLAADPSNRPSDARTAFSEVSTIRRKLALAGQRRDLLEELERLVEAEGGAPDSGANHRSSLGDG